MRNRLIILLVALGTALAASFMIVTQSHDDVTISDAYCVMENGKNVARFTAHNRTTTSMMATAEITVYSERPNGISTDPVVAGIKTAQFTLNPRETKIITEEVAATREPIVLIQGQRVEVKVIKTERK